MHANTPITAGGGLRENSVAYNRPRENGREREGRETAKVHDPSAARENDGPVPEDIGQHRNEQGPTSLLHHSQDSRGPRRRPVKACGPGVDWVR